MPTPDFSKVWASNSPLPAYTFTDADYLTGWDFVGSAPPTKNEFDAWFRATDEKLNYLYSQLQDTASKLYPVGSVYISFNATDPTTLFGGTWVRLKDRMLMASGDSYAPNTTGGSATVTLTTSNIPSHTHSLTTNGSHTHSASANTTGNHVHTVSGSIANAGDHTHSWSGSMDKVGNHTHTITASASTVPNHTHAPGSMNITGNISGWDVQGDAKANGAFSISSRGNYKDAGGVYESNYANNFHFDASTNWTGKTSADGGHTHTISASASTTGDHKHTVTGTNAKNGTHNHTWSGSVATNGNHTHTISVVANGNHTHTVGNTGGGLPINTLPPYQTVFMWRRTA